MIAGIGLLEARHLSPGWVMDMYMIRMDYDMRVGWGQGIRRMM